MTASTGDPAATEAVSPPPPTSAQGDIPADTFGARLVLARYHAGRLSIERAAERCDLNSENWRRWEDGSKPRDKVDVAQAVSNGLRINFEWLLLGGPLLPARGRPTPVVTGEYQRVAEWVAETTAAMPRRARIVGLPQLMAA